MIRAALMQSARQRESSEHARHETRRAAGGIAAPRRKVMPLRPPIAESHPPVDCHTAPFAFASERCQKSRRFPAQSRENVSAFGIFLHEEPTRVPARLDEAVSPQLADAFVDEQAD